jgi:hypothetical protein
LERFFIMRNTTTVVLALATVACGTDSNAGTSTQGTAYVLEDTAVVSIGGLDDRPEYQLQYTVGAVRLSDGRIVVADAGSRDLRYYDVNGLHLHTVGREGDGPGEFRGLRTIARVRGDTVVAWDPRLRRASFFDDGGAFAADVALTGWAAVNEGGRQPPLFVYTIHVTRQGEFVVEPFLEYNLSRYEQPYVTHDTIPILGFDRSSEHARLVGHFPASQLFLHSRSGGHLTFGNALLFAAAGDGVWVGSSHEGVLHAMTLGGDTLRTVGVPFERRPVRPQDVPPPRTGVTAGWANAMPIPDSMPLLAAARVSADDRLWVQKYRAPLDERQEWVALDDAGGVLATLSMDADIQVLDIARDHAIVLVRDELDVEQVQVRRFRPRVEAER